MDNCPFKIGDWVQTFHLGVGRVHAFCWSKENKDWKIVVKFENLSINVGFNSESIRKATYLEILIYG